MIEVIYALAGIGILFNFLGGIGLVRFPDVYTRLHAETKCTTFGSIFIVLAILLYELVNWSTNSWVMSFHSIIALIALIITNPAGAHAIARAAHRSGVHPKEAVVDSYEKVKR
ncbi:MAG: monovalent cation/H(+) antiporter subunit G [Candidatus Diapherotrites archaeon]|nr:monovalent cation/H(+) antiporter subunit G [Candidatus Diapherotrites archaeon]